MKPIFLWITIALLSATGFSPSAHGASGSSVTGDAPFKSLFPVVSHVVGAALLALFVVGVTVLLARSFKADKSERPGILLACAWIVLYMEGQIALMFLVNLVRPASRAENFAIAGLLGTVPVLVALRKFRRQPWGVPFAWPSSLSFKQVGLAFGGLFLILLLNGLYAAIYILVTGHVPAQERSIHLVAGMLRFHPFLAVTFVALLGPIVEETLFRGLLFGSLEKRLNRWTIPATAIAFGAFHLDPAHFIPLTVIGMFLGWARWKTGSIWLSVILHMMVNGFAMTVLYFLPQAVK